jgi:hypothetical protein
MIANTIVYVILSVLSVTAVYAASTPFVKAPKEQHQSGEEEKDSTNTL